MLKSPLVTVSCDTAIFKIKSGKTPPLAADVDLITQLSMDIILETYRGTGETDFLVSTFACGTPHISDASGRLYKQFIVELTSPVKHYIVRSQITGNTIDGQITGSDGESAAELLDYYTIDYQLHITSP